MSQQQHPSYLRQEGESRDAYSDRFLAWHRNFNSTQIRMMRHKMYEKTFKSTKKMTNRNDVTHNTKHTILINKTKFTPYSVPPAHAPASVF
jgi:hypothetical protein